MKIIGLTGPSGSGKSTFADIAKGLKISVIDCDSVAREVADDDNLLKSLAENFGESIIENGKLNRKALANIAFCSKEKTELLNSIILPVIVDEIRTRLADMEKKGERVVLLDAPTLYESGIDSICDSVIVVLSDKNLRKKRIMKRDNLTESDAEIRLSAARDDEFYKLRAEHILYNNESVSEYIKNAEDLLKKLI